MNPAMTPSCLHRLLMLTVAFALVGLPGCRIPEEQVRDTPLAVDPTDVVDLAGWWSNGRELLRMEPDGEYRMYATVARMQPPMHHGRWEKVTHNRVTLEPYTELQTESLTAQITTVDNEIVLRVPGYRDFSRTTTPEPAAPIDEEMDLPPPIGSTA